MRIRYLDLCKPGVLGTMSFLGSERGWIMRIWIWSCFLQITLIHWLNGWYHLFFGDGRLAGLVGDPLVWYYYRAEHKTLTAWD